MHTLPVDRMQPDLQLYYSAFCRLPVNGVLVHDLGAMNVECTFVHFVVRYMKSWSCVY